MNVLELKGNLRIVLRKAFNVILLGHSIDWPSISCSLTPPI